MAAWEDQHQYLALRSIVAERTRKIGVWCGAGLSQAAGLPSWKELRKKLESALASKLAALDITPQERTARLRSVKSEKNPWVAFHRLSSSLGPITYRETIREALTTATTVAVPDTYRKLWTMKPWGMINLNLDRLGTRGYLEAGLPAGSLVEFKGKEIASHSHALSGPRSFLCNIHGVAEDANSWVFTQPELKQLFSDEAYRTFVSAFLTTSVVVFLGLTIEDIAVGGHLERMSQAGMHNSAHFWITDRRDVVGDRWAEKNGVRIIRYDSSNAHRQLSEIIDALVSYVPKEPESVSPITPDVKMSDDMLPSPQEVSKLEPEQIRKVLNREARRILQPGGEASLIEYSNFIKKYDRAVHLAWYASVEEGESVFLGIRLESEVARGAFGTVYRGYTDSGEAVAVKLLHNEIRMNVDLLNAFRRGVRSMQILSNSNVRGMARIKIASEIPASVAMEWIDGASLKDIGESRTLNEWHQVLEIAVQLVTIVSDAHSLPERVLHRDIRPSNIMVEGYWEGDDQRVRVLDFDLSWHRGAAEKSVIYGSAMSGYLAPEQLERRVGVSTQNALVDAFGIGMTIYFVLSGRNPLPGEHLQTAWNETVLKCVDILPVGSWRSVAARVARLLLHATNDTQSMRWDISQILGELRRLQDAELQPMMVDSAELIAEEIAVRAIFMRGYSWDDGELMATYKSSAGLVIQIRGDESSRRIHLSMIRMSTPGDDRNIVPALNRCKDSVSSVLSKSLWSGSAGIGQGCVTVEAVFGVGSPGLDVARLAKEVDALAERLRFS